MSKQMIPIDRRKHNIIYEKIIERERPSTIEVGQDGEVERYWYIDEDISGFSHLAELYLRPPMIYTPSSVTGAEDLYACIEGDDTVRVNVYELRGGERLALKKVLVNPDRIEFGNTVKETIREVYQSHYTGDYKVRDMKPRRLVYSSHCGNQIPKIIDCNIIGFADWEELDDKIEEEETGVIEWEFVDGDSDE